MFVTEPTEERTVLLNEIELPASHSMKCPIPSFLYSCGDEWFYILLRSVTYFGPSSKHF